MPVGFVIVRGRSMLPTLSDGDRLLARYLPAYGARVVPGEVLVVRFPDGVVAVKRAESVAPEGVYVSRDNPAEGRDSWTLGGVAIAPEDVLARVVARVWPRPRLRLPRAR